MDKYLHSVELIQDRCIGCTDCIKRCPTSAIRVRDGKAVIKDYECIDCGMCIKVCTSFAKKAVTDTMDLVKKYKCKVAIPAPTLYSQFKNIMDVNIILTAIKKLGFDEVFEVSKAAEMVTEATRELIKEKDLKKPIISSACPAIIRLITMRFPSLIDNILPLIAPMEASAIMVKNYLVSQGIKREDIGVFFISPCAAKKTNTVVPLGIEKSEVDGVISISDIYMKLRFIISKLEKNEIEILAQSNPRGIDWAISGGESKGIDIDNAIAVDGIENVIKILEEVENEQLSDIDFIEGLACTGGCVGGPLTLVNSFVAKNNLKKIEHHMNIKGDERKRFIDFKKDEINFDFTKPISAVKGLELDEDFAIALKKMEQMNFIYESLPRIDCGSCGAPTCLILAEDIVRGKANIEDCIFMLRKKVKDLAEIMFDLTSKMPQTISEK